MDKIFYNESSSAKLGWKPEWLGAQDFDEDLILRIEKFQKSLGLKADGMLGPSTYRRLYLERSANISDYQPRNDNYSDHIVCNGEFVGIDWPKVVLWDEGLKIEGRYKAHKGKRNVNLFVNHWDVCLNSAACCRVLNKRGLSIHFMIDNDGTIYQGMDCNDIAYHAGASKWNNASVGVEISNAYYTKYQSWYVKNGFGSRPLVNGETVHDRPMKTFTGFYDVQVAALKALWKACADYYDIPLRTPLSKDGSLLKKVSPTAAAGRYSGFVNHYHLTRNKIDCAGLDIKKLLEEIKSN